jgi:hypothetical protein
VLSRLQTQLTLSPLAISTQETESSLDKFYKGGSQEKTLLLRPEFFLLPSPLDRAGSVLTARTRCSVAGQYRPAVGVFSTSGFHRFLATKPVRSETHQAERGQIWRP